MAKVKVDILYKKDLAKTPLMAELILPSQWSVMQGQGGVSVTGNDIKDETITGDNIEGATITAAEIANATITGNQIANATITATNITAATITANEIANATITATEIANATITATQIENATITGTQISGTAGITGGQIANATIIGTNISGIANIAGSQLSATAGLVGAQIANTTITGGNLVNNTIGTTQIALAAITGSLIANSTITGGNIANNTIEAGQIANATITGSEIANTTIAGGNIINNTITATQIGNATITNTQIANATITATQIENATITATQIQNLTITGGKIANATITNAQIGSLSASKITAGTMNAARINGGDITGVTITGVTVTGGTVRTNNATYPHAVMDSGGLTINGEYLTFNNTSGTFKGQLFYYSTTNSLYLATVTNIDLDILGDTVRINAGNDYVYLQTGASNKLRVESTGIRPYVSIIPTSSSLSLGSSSYKWNTLYMNGGSSIYWSGTSYYFKHDGSNFRINDDLQPHSDGSKRLGYTNLAWYAVHSDNYLGCNLPASESGVDIFKKIKSPKLKDGTAKGFHAGKRHYFEIDEFPDEMKMTDKDSGKKDIEITRTLGVTVGAVKELVETIENLKERLANTETKLNEVENLLAI